MIKDIKCFDPMISIPDRSTKKVYHYTSPEGLYSILENATIRFTDCQFLNDKSEAMYIRDPLMKVLNDLKTVLKPEFREAVEDLFNQNLETELLYPSYGGIIKNYLREEASYFIFCLSEEKDSLNMWNYYIKNDNYQGYNICFTINQLVKCLEKVNYNNMKLFYGQVLYTYKDQAAALQNMLIERNNEYIENLSVNENKEKVLEAILFKVTDYINDYKLFYKDEAFMGEKEYRFIMKIPNNYLNDDNKQKMGFSIKKGVFTPYCDLKINLMETINSFTLAPMMEKDLAIMGLKRFMKKCQCNSKIPIESSCIPIRY